MKILSKVVYRDGGSISYRTDLGEVVCWRAISVFGTPDFDTLWFHYPGKSHGSRRLNTQEILEFTNALMEYVRVAPHPSDLADVIVHAMKENGARRMLRALELPEGLDIKSSVVHGRRCSLRFQEWRELHETRRAIVFIMEVPK